MKLAPINTIINKIKYKKILIPFIIILLILPLIFFTKAPKSDQEQINNIQQEQTPIISQNQFPQALNLPKWDTYKGKTFSVQYAPDWSLQQNKVINGGELIEIKPSALPEGYNYPRFIIQTEPQNEIRLKQKIELLKGLGLKESTTIIAGIKAKKYSGTIPFKKINNTTIKEPVQESVILFSNKNTLYTIKYSYEGEQVKGDMEVYFDNLAGDITLQ